MTSSVSRKKLDIDEHGEDIEETTKMLTQPIDSDESIPLSSKRNNSNDETTSSHCEPETATLDHTAATSDWYLEGVRRVRYDNVQRKMRYLTGTAAIGGFLFGYDTGKETAKVVKHHFCKKSIIICNSVLLDMRLLTFGLFNLLNNRCD
jgi:hypothetical protein